MNTKDDLGSDGLQGPDRPSLSVQQRAAAREAALLALREALKGAVPDMSTRWRLEDLALNYGAAVGSHICAMSNEIWSRRVGAL